MDAEANTSNKVPEQSAAIKSELGTRFARIEGAKLGDNLV